MFRWRGDSKSFRASGLGSEIRGLTAFRVEGSTDLG